MITITISGPTISGKSSLCVAIAEFLYRQYGIDSTVHHDGTDNMAICDAILCTMQGQTVEITEVHIVKGDI